MLTPEEEQFLKQMQQDKEQAVLNQSVAQYNQTRQQLALEDLEKGFIKEQLDLSEELDTIEHLLRGHILTQKPDGSREWVEPEDNELVIFTDYGIYLILNTILFYMNKNTLLSNYEDKIILQKMEDFSTDLADTIFMEYEKVFNYPTFEDCKKVLLQRLDKRTELREFALEMMGKKKSKEKIKQEFIDEMEGRIDTEITKIKEQIIKNKLKRFLILMRTLQDSVHSTYLRAWNGQERRTLRQRINVNENVNPPMPPQKQPSKLNPLNHLR